MIKPNFRYNKWYNEMPGDKCQDTIYEGSQDHDVMPNQFVQRNTKATFKFQLINMCDDELDVEHKRTTAALDGVRQLEQSMAQHVNNFGALVA